MIGQLLVLTLAGLSVAQVCPPAEVLSPCVCDQTSISSPVLHCNHISEQFDLKGILDNASRFIDDDFVFGSLQIVNSSLVEIVEGAVEHLKFRHILISRNPNLEYISPQAFNETRNVTTGLELSRNNLRNESNIFEVINNFEKLRQVDVVDSITSIPDHAFKNLPFLEGVHLASNNISRIGSQAFATGSEDYLRFYVTLFDNSIPAGGLSEDAFGSIASNRAEFAMECNEMEFMEQSSFQTLLDRAARVTVGGFNCPGGGDSPRRFHCDERADYICDNETAYRPKLIGFRCKDVSRFEDIWDYCAMRNMALVKS